MNNSQEKLFKNSLIELKNILTKLENKPYTDASYLTLQKKLQSICSKLQQSKPNKSKKHHEKGVSINEFFADGWPEGPDD